MFDLRHRLVQPVALAILFAAALLIRVPGFAGDGILPVREFRSAIIARDVSLIGREDVPSWRREVARAAREYQDPLEPPLIEYVTGAVWRLLHDEPRWVPHLLVTLAWLAGGWLLVLLARSAFPAQPGVAVPVAAYYLFAPIGIRISGAFQPDALMIALTVAGLYTVFRHAASPTRARFWTAACTTSAAVLVKPTSIFVLALAFLACLVWRSGWRRASAGAEGLLFGVVAALPASLYYAYLSFVVGRMREQAVMSFQPHLWLQPDHWMSWLRLAVDGAGLPFLLVGLVAPLAARGSLRALLLGAWTGYVALGVVFPYHIESHDYYHLPLLPLIGLSIGVLLAGAPGNDTRRFMLSTAVVLAMLGLHARLAPTGWNHPFLPAPEAARIGELTGHSSRAVFVARDYGVPLQYLGEMAGRPWPRPLVYRHGTSHLIGRLSMAERLNGLGFSPEYFVVTNRDALDRHHEDLKTFLLERCVEIAASERFTVWGRCAQPSPSK